MAKKKSQKFHTKPTAGTQPAERGGMSVLIVNPPLLIEADYVDHPYFANLGALQHAAVLRERGHSVEVADAFSLVQSDAYVMEDGRLMIGCGNDTLLSSIKGKKFDAVAVCLSVFHRPFTRHDFTAALMRLLREKFPHAPIIAADAYFGGMHYIDYTTDAFFKNYPEADYHAKGESEHELARLVEALPDGELSTGEPACREIADLDSLPFPAWDAIDTDNYFDFLSRFFVSTGRAEDFTRFHPYLPITTSRGCVYNCTFCYAGNRSTCRRHSIEYIDKYLRQLKKNYRISGVVILDGLANAGKFNQVLELLESLGLKVSFANGLRADLLSRSHIKQLAKLTPGIAISAESASERVRNELLGKKLQLEAVEKVAGWCAASKLPLGIHYMAGVPGETAAETNATLEHALRMSSMHGAVPLMQLCVPLPGARMHDGIVARDDSNWNADGYFSRFHSGAEPANDSFPREDLTRMMKLFEKRISSAATEKLIVNLTYKCNNRCAMCAVGGRPLMSVEFDKCARLLAEYYSRGVRYVDFDGGEPTLHPDLFGIIESARRLGYERINITTNGRTLASRGYASRLLLSGISGILISVYGHTREVHEKVTLSPGSFGETMQGVRHALRLKPDRVSFGANTVLTSSNWRHAGRLMGMLCDLGVRNLNAQFPTPFGRAAASHLPPMKAATELLAAAMDEYSGRLDVRIINLPPCMMPGHEDEALVDVEKFSRHMAFVDTPPENLGTYLAGKRRRKKKCFSCPYYVVCEGFYEFDSGE